MTIKSKKQRSSSKKRNLTERHSLVLGSSMTVCCSPCYTSIVCWFS